MQISARISGNYSIAGISNTLINIYLFVRFISAENLDVILLMILLVLLEWGVVAYENTKTLINLKSLSLIFESIQVPFLFVNV